jgi:dUTPase
MMAAAKKVRVKILDENAKVPLRAHSTDTGYDVAFTGVHKISGDVIFFKTGLSFEPPHGYYFEVLPRSSISKLPLVMANSVGIIDESYRGEVLIPVRVTHQAMGKGNVENTVFPGGLVDIFGKRPSSMSVVADLVLKEKPVLFQIILRKRNDCDFIIEDLSETERGEGGFGSSG